MSTAETVQAAKERLTMAVNDEKAHWSLMAGSDACVDLPVADVKALLADHARLEGENERLRNDLDDALHDYGNAESEAKGAEADNEDLKAALTEARREVAEQISRTAELVTALSLVRMSRGWQYMADETREIVDRALQRGEQPDPARIAEIAKSEACRGDDGMICEGDCTCKRKARGEQPGGGEEETAKPDLRTLVNDYYGKMKVSDCNAIRAKLALPAPDSTSPEDFRAQDLENAKVAGKLVEMAREVAALKDGEA